MSCDTYVEQQSMAGLRERSPMREGWRSEAHRPRDDRAASYRQHSYSHQYRDRKTRSPPARHSHHSSQARPRPDHPRSNQKRPPPQRSSFSPARSQRGSAGRSRYPIDSGFDSRGSSPTRYSKRRRTRSPSPSDWSDRGDYNQRRQYSRSRSRDRFEKRDGRQNHRRESPSRGSSPARSGRPRSREPLPDIDSYKPDRRRQEYPQSREYPKRSPSPQYRSVTPPRRRSVSPPRDYHSRQASPPSRYDSPIPSHHPKPRDKSRSVEPSRKRSLTRTPSPIPVIDRDPMDGPYTVRGNHGHQNFVPRGRGYRGYGSRGGAYRDSPIVSTPNSSHHGSPQSHVSYQGGRNPWDNPPPSRDQRYVDQSYHYGDQALMQYRSNGPPYRSNARPVSDQMQDDYYRHTPPHNQTAAQNGRSYRGRGGPMNSGYPPGPDRRFSGPFDPPSAPRGRGVSYSHNATWTANRREVPPTQSQTASNSVRASPIPAQPAQNDSKNLVPEEKPFDPPRGPQSQIQQERQDEQPVRREEDTLQNGRDSKFSFALKSKPPPQSTAKPPAELSFQPKLPPTQPASTRPPPTQPRGIKFQEKRPYQNSSQIFQDRRPDDRQPPKGPSQYQDRSRAIPTSPRTRSRSPPPKRIKHETKPTLTPEMAASDSIYYRKPGNESVVGAGTYGKVFKAIHIFTKDLVALKKIRMEGERDGFPITAVREIKLLQNLRHRHVVALHEVMVEKNECFMVFEYLSHDLTGLINHPTFKLSPAHKKDLGRQMFEGLEFLHRRGVMHRDIKAANLLISSTGRLKYADFGLARGYTKTQKLDYTNRVITIWYRPPELLLGETQYGPAVDVWSAACVFMEMFTRKAIFPGEGGELSQLEKIYNVLGSPTRDEWPGIAELPWFELMQVETKTRVFEDQYGDVLSEAGLDLVRSIFQFDPARRPDALEVLRHEYFVSEMPRAQQAWELESAGGDWHEYESKAHRRENERKEKERRREEREKEKKRKDDGKVDEVPPAPMPAGEESDGEGSARMSMS